MTNTVDIKSHLNELDSYEFERLVATLWKVYGWQTTLTSRSHDEGIDVIANRTMPVKKSLLIQVKAYKSEKVYSDEVSYYSDLYTQNPDADEVVLVTTSSFSSPAIELATELDVSLVSGEDLNRLIRNSKLRYADLSSVVSCSSTSDVDWIWKSFDSIEPTEHSNVDKSAQRIEQITSLLQEKQKLNSLKGPAFVHPRVPYEDQTCSDCVTSTVYSIEAQHTKLGLRRWKICSDCLRLWVKEEDQWRLVKHFHPFNNDQVAADSTPVRSNEWTVCPVCRSNYTLWIAENKHKRQLLLCSDCNTVWKLVPGSKNPIYWRCIQRERKNISLGAIFPQSAFHKSHA